MDRNNFQLIESQLSMYNASSKQEEINAIKEIFQEIALAALSRTSFFKQAAFQGGTCLRIFFGLPRFSEDLDFILMKPDKNFVWEPFLRKIKEEFSAYGLHLSVKERADIDKSVKMAFLKEDSFGQLFTLSFPMNRAEQQKIQIRLEIDINPPEGSSYETRYLQFPFPSSVITQDLSSSFAGKCHALLCRPFHKGRDWFDFLWYISRKIPVNLNFLKKALFQAGPWKGQTISLSKIWLSEALIDKIQIINWKSTVQDLSPFLKKAELQGLDLWSVEFFSDFAQRIQVSKLDT